MNLLKKIDNIIERIFHIFLCLMMTAIVVIVFFEVFSRYLFSNSHGWSDEILRMLLIWITFISLMLVQREDKHLRMEMMYKKFPKKVQFIMNIFGIALSIAMCIFFAYYGIKYCNKFASSKSAILEISYRIVYGCMPIGFISLAYQQVIDFVTYLKKNTGKEN